MSICAVPVFLSYGFGTTFVLKSSIYIIVPVAVLQICGIFCAFPKQNTKNQPVGTVLGLNYTLFHISSVVCRFEALFVNIYCEFRSLFSDLLNHVNHLRFGSKWGAE